MTTTPPIVNEAESLVSALADELTVVRPGECLVCYLARQLVVSGCGGWSHVLRYRDAVAPRATAVVERLRDVGACCCDCELFMNGYELDRRRWPPKRRDDGDGDVFFMDVKDPDALPRCAGVRRGSVRPCTNWVRIRRPSW